jgi:hypothetical protein
MGGPFEQIYADHTLPTGSTEVPEVARGFYHRTTLSVGTAWGGSTQEIPFEQSNLDGFSFTVEGFEVAFELTRNRALYCFVFRYNENVFAAPFGAAFVTYRTRGSDRQWQDEGRHSPIRSALLPTTMQEILLRRWTQIPDPQDRAMVQTFWLGHEVPALAALGLASLSLLPMGPATPGFPTPHAEPAHLKHLEASVAPSVVPESAGRAPTRMVR